jgi:hypothetical protein
MDAVRLWPACAQASGDDGPAAFLHRGVEGKAEPVTVHDRPQYGVHVLPGGEVVSALALAEIDAPVLRDARHLRLRRMKRLGELHAGIVRDDLPLHPQQGFQLRHVNAGIAHRQRDKVQQRSGRLGRLRRKSLSDGLQFGHTMIPVNR